ncbi:MAG: hypothetical protein KI792_13440 [Alphaproteobacteria bacterium]|nr:hypothetical protein [Alphaproteobacteria bacterium SS10]
MRYMKLAKTLSFQRHADVPAAPEGYWHAYQGISSTGEGLFLCKANEPGSGEDKAPLKLFIVTPKATKQIEITLLHLEDPAYVTTFPDGRLLLVEPRSQLYRDGTCDQNAAVYDPITGHAYSFLIGDAVTAIGVDGRGRIWASFYDEGIFGNYGWGEGDSPLSPGEGGLVCFDDHGELLWSFNHVVKESSIDDCYALNITTDGVWINYYEDFRICQIGMDQDDTDFEVQFFQSRGINGSDAIAVSDDAFLLSRQYGEANSRFHLIRRDGKLSEKPQAYRAKLPDGRLDIRHLNPIGHGSRMHLIGEAGWFSVDVGEVD